MSHTMRLTVIDMSWHLRRLLLMGKNLAAPEGCIGYGGRQGVHNRATTSRTETTSALLNQAPITQRPELQVQILTAANVAGSVTGSVTGGTDYYIPRRVYPLEIRIGR